MDRMQMNSFLTLSISYFCRPMNTMNFRVGQEILKCSMSKITLLQNSFVVTEDLSLTAEFVEMSYHLNILASAGASYISPNSGYFGSLQTVGVGTSAAEGYTFLQWQDPYDILSNPYSTETDANISRIAYVDDAYVSALFEPTQYEIGVDINITSQQGGQINREDIQYYQHFQTYDLSALTKWRIYI